tara:strand:+ start:101 stop:301 length:201 start_codon:yes stop_codon:yes gene_type:complete
MKNPMKKKRTVKKKSGLRPLTLRQKSTLKRHSVHHTKKHMALMRRLMKQGKTFGHAHKTAMKKVGK